MVTEEENNTVGVIVLYPLQLLCDLKSDGGEKKSKLMR